MESEAHEFIARDNRRYTVLVIYDISDTKRRNKMVAFLEQYTTRVQKSAFEGSLTPREYEAVTKGAPKFIRKTTDSLRIYILADSSTVRSWGLGEVRTDDVIII